MSPEKPKETKKAREVKHNLDEIVAKLNRSAKSSEDWDSSVGENPEAWEHLKHQISQKQIALKELVDEKKAGRIGADEFESRYRTIQDELTELEFAVYNMKLGTNVE